MYSPHLEWHSDRDVAVAELGEAPDFEDSVLVVGGIVQAAVGIASVVEEIVPAPEDTALAVAGIELTPVEIALLEAGEETETAVIIVLVGLNAILHYPPVSSLAIAL